MKVSDLIIKLTETLDQYGDLPIVVDWTDDDEELLMTAANKVNVCEWDFAFGGRDDFKLGDKFIYIRYE